MCTLASYTVNQQNSLLSVCYLPEGPEQQKLNTIFMTNKRASKASNSTLI